MNNNDLVNAERVRLISLGVIREDEDLHTLATWCQSGYKLKPKQIPISVIVLWFKIGNNFHKRKTALYSTRQVEKRA